MQKYKPAYVKGFPSAEPSANGEFVKFADASAVIEQLTKALAESKVRGSDFRFREKAPQHLRGRSKGAAAYESGFEVAFRGWYHPDSGYNPYTAEPHFSAFCDGMKVGEYTAVAMTLAALEAANR